jgi:hypothetical protein
MILLCIASDNYKLKYLSCIESQERYCSKMNYTYKLVSGPDDSRNWKRAKVEELTNIINATDDDILLIDGDCYIKDICPPIDFLTEDKSIFYVNGKSGRLNSGFLYFKNNNHSRDFVAELKEKLKCKLPRGRGYFVTTEGENGHVIWLQDEWIKSEKNVFQEIGFEWNCASPKLKQKAYILHFTGLLRKEIYKYNENLRTS